LYMGKNMLSKKKLNKLPTERLLKLYKSVRDKFYSFGSAYYEELMWEEKDLRKEYEEMEDYMEKMKLILDTRENIAK
jgi:hypothetical protein